MPRLSVVVPIYDVEAYLPDCLDSLLRQEVDDWEAILVDDGSPDGSAAIAERYAERDGRFRLVRQANGGLGSARNTGAAHATGELLTFLDSDDMVTPDGYARLLRALDRTGSDFATGNIHRFTAAGSWPAVFCRKAFVVSRRRTHVSRLRFLLSDRMAQNKVFRRAFWERHAFRFPVGVLHEDIPVTIPAHVLARSVDVVREPVYLYRRREEEATGPSITQRRAELRALRDRLSAVEQVSAFLHDRPGRLARWYDESVVEDDLRYHIDILDEADDEYRTFFMQRAGAFLHHAGPGIEDRLPAIQRLKWHLVREGRLEELLEVLRFQRAGGTRRKVLIRGRAYGDYPFLRDPAAGIPLSVFRLDTTARRARHVGALARPYVAPRRRAPASLS